MRAHKLLRADGFTMVELVVTMVIIGIMAFVALPKFDSLGAFDARGFRDQTVSTLRFAQKTAIAQRRAVCVTTSGTGVTLTIAAAATDSSGCSGATLNPPFTAKAGTGLAVTSFNFLRKGETDATSNVTLTVSGADDISIDYETGYVR